MQWRYLPTIQLLTAARTPSTILEHVVKHEFGENPRDQVGALVETGLTDEAIEEAMRRMGSYFAADNGAESVDTSSSSRS